MCPGWKIFFEEKLTFKENSRVVIEEVQEEIDWMDYMYAKTMATLLTLR